MAIPWGRGGTRVNTIGQGGLATFIDAQFRDGTGAAVTPTSPLVDLLDPNDVVVVNNAVPDLVAAGLYAYPSPGYQLATNAPLGVWKAHWTGNVNGVPVSSDDYFTVVAAGGIGFPTTVLLTVDEVVAHVGAVVDAGDEAVIEAQVALYQGELESILGRGVTLAVRTESIPILTRTDGLRGLPPRIGEVGNRWYARRGPVRSITSITAGSAVMLPANYTRTRDGAELWGGTPMVAGEDLVATYAGGWDYPDNLPAKQAVMGRVARWWNKRTDDDVGAETSGVEGHTVKWMPDEFTPAELSACARLRAPDFAA